MTAASFVEEDLSIPLVSSTTGQSYRLYGKEVKLVPEVMMTLSPSTNDVHETTTTNDSVQDEEAAANNSNNHERDDDSRHPDDDDTTSPASCCWVVIVVHGGPGLADSSESFPGLKRLLLAAAAPAKSGGSSTGRRQEKQQDEQEEHPKRRRQQQRQQQMSILRSMVFYDQLGCGKSDKPTSMEEYSLSAYVNELRQVIAYCRARHSSDNKRVMVCLLGHSWGGQVILEYVLSLDPNDTTPAAAAPHCAVISNAPLDATSYQAKQVELRESLDPETREFYEREEEQEIAQNQGVGARIFRKLVGTSDTRITGELKEWTVMRDRRLKRLSTPCLFVCCEDDTVPVADYRKLLLLEEEKGAGPLLADEQCCEVTILPEGGHGPFYGASAPMYFERILSFLLGTQPAV